MYIVLIHSIAMDVWAPERGFRIITQVGVRFEERARVTRGDRLSATRMSAADVTVVDYRFESRVQINRSININLLASLVSFETELAISR